MDLIDRYLHAVQGYLPKQAQDDLVKELAEDIRSQIEEREAERGRPLANAELEAFLKQMGHPMVLAARFQPQRHLIGPTMFPFFQRTVLIAVGVALLVNVVVAATLVASGRPGREIMDTLLRFPATIGMTVFGWVTLVFAVGEWALGHTKVIVGWDPATLPPVQKDVPQVSRLHAVSGIVTGAGGLVYLLLIPAHPWLLFGPAALFLEIGPELRRFYVAVLVLVALSMVMPVVNLLRPDLVRMRSVSRLAFGLAGLVLYSLLIDAGPYVVLKAGAGMDQHADGVKALNLALRIGFVVAWLATAADFMREAWRLWRAYRRTAAPA